MTEIVNNQPTQPLFPGYVANNESEYYNEDILSSIADSQGNVEPEDDDFFLSDGDAQRRHRGINHKVATNPQDLADSKQRSHLKAPTPQIVKATPSHHPQGKVLNQF